MSEVIRRFYEKAQTIPAIIENKINRFEANPDIKDEFESWIVTKKYKADSAIMVEGYTAQDLAKLSPYIDGEGAFVLLMELRENPEKAKRRIEAGFKMR